MTQFAPLAPCLTAHLFRPLHSELLMLLRSLTDDEWSAQTVAPKWKVRDVAAHLLDVDLRRIAVSRDGHSRRSPNRRRPIARSLHWSTP